MYYDPIKNVFAGVIKKIPSLRILFYKILDLMFLRSWYVRRELRKIRSLSAGKELSIYDAGTGFGQYTYFMAKKLQPNKIYAVDVKEDWIKDCEVFFKTQKLQNVKLGVEDLTQIHHKEKFDLITCIDVMEHIEDDIKVFQNFYQALKKDGFLLINSPSTFGGSDVHENEDESFIGEHARDGYSYEDLKNKLEPIGFSVYQSKYTYGFWGDKGWRLGIKIPMKLLNVSKLFFVILPFYYILTFPLAFLFMWIDFKLENKIGSGINFIAKKI
ncbi:MAG: class I SAM-dependent methyltransferase [Ignavibacteriales bacterium]|nr:class I SAM-dependent methyltransferase [Ignavibacteriales bacterium]